MVSPPYFIPLTAGERDWLSVVILETLLRVLHVWDCLYVIMSLFYLELSVFDTRILLSVFIPLLFAPELRSEFGAVFVYRTVLVMHLSC
jgi:hypothetical protein